MLYLENGAWRETYRPGIGDLSDSGYQIQRTRPGSGYVWHHDSMLFRGICP